MSSHATLNLVENKIADDLKSNPDKLQEVFKELHQLRAQDGSDQVFKQDLAVINKDLQDKNILPNLQIVMDPQSEFGFNLQKMLKDWQTSGGSANSAGSDSSSGGTGSGGSSGGGGRQSGDSSSGGSSSGVSDGSQSAQSPESSPADPNLPSDVPSGSLADQIIKAGESVGGREGTVGMCLKGVQDSLDSIGIKMTRRNYASDMAGDFAADTKHFQEVNPGSPQPGDIIVHGGTAKNPAGHIAIVLPNGKESSDHIQNLISTQVTADFGPSRVFRPIA